MVAIDSQLIGKSEEVIDTAKDRLIFEMLQDAIGTERRTWAEGMGMNEDYQSLFKAVEQWGAAQMSYRDMKPGKTLANIVFNPNSFNPRTMAEQKTKPQQNSQYKNFKQISGPRPNTWCNNHQRPGHNTNECKGINLPKNKQQQTNYRRQNDYRQNNNRRQQNGRNQIQMQQNSYNTSPRKFVQTANGRRVYCIFCVANNSKMDVPCGHCWKHNNESISVTYADCNKCKYETRIENRSLFVPYKPPREAQTKTN